MIPDHTSDAIKNVPETVKKRIHKIGLHTVIVQWYAAELSHMLITPWKILTAVMTCTLHFHQHYTMIKNIYLTISSGNIQNILSAKLITWSYSNNRGLTWKKQIMKKMDDGVGKLSLKKKKTNRLVINFELIILLLCPPPWPYSMLIIGWWYSTPEQQLHFQQTLYLLLC